MAALFALNGFRFGLVDRWSVKYGYHVIASAMTPYRTDAMDSGYNSSTQAVTQAVATE